MVNPNCPSWARESWTVSISPVTALRTVAGIPLSPRSTSRSRSWRRVSSGMSRPLTVQSTPSPASISRVMSWPASSSNTSRSKVVRPGRRVISTVSPGRASWMSSMARSLREGVGRLVPPPPPLYAQFAVMVVSAAGMVKVVLVLEASAKVPPFEVVQPVKR